MKLARVFCFLVILGSSAVAASAQTDIHVTLNDPSCAFSFCVQLMVTGPGTDIDALLFNVTGGTYAPPFVCDTNIVTNDAAWTCTVKTSGGVLSGFLFEQPSDGLAPGDFLALSSNIPVQLGQSGNTVCVPVSACPGGELIPLLTATPEPPSFVLFMTGLLLFSLGGFARKRLGANFHT